MDFPAPFSPSSACTSPARTSRFDVAQRSHAAKALVDAVDHHKRRRRPELCCNRTRRLHLLLPLAPSTGTMVTFCYYCNLLCYNSIRSSHLSMGDCAGERLGIGTNKTDARHLLTARRPAIASPRRPVQVGHFGRCWDVDRSRPGAVRVREMSRRRGAASHLRYSERPMVHGRRPPDTARAHHVSIAPNIGATSWLWIRGQTVELRAEYVCRKHGGHRLRTLRCGSGLPRLDDRQVVAGIFAPFRIE